MNCQKYFNWQMHVNFKDVCFCYIESPFLLDFIWQCCFIISDGHNPRIATAYDGKGIRGIRARERCATPVRRSCVRIRHFRCMRQRDSSVVFRTFRWSLPSLCKGKFSWILCKRHDDENTDSPIIGDPPKWMTIGTNIKGIWGQEWWYFWLNWVISEVNTITRVNRLPTPPFLNHSCLAWLLNL